MTATATRRGERGFTFVELLVTLAVSGIALAGILATQVVAVRTNGLASSSTDAVAVAQRTIEEARGLSVNQMLVEYQDPENALPIDYSFGNTTVLGRTTTYLRRLVVDELGAGTGLIRLRAEVRWGDNGASPYDARYGHLVSFEVLRTRQ